MCVRPSGPSTVRWSATRALKEALRSRGNQERDRQRNRGFFSGMLRGVSILREGSKILSFLFRPQAGVQLAPTSSKLMEGEVCEPLRLSHYEVCGNDDLRKFSQFVPSTATRTSAGTTDPTLCKSATVSIPEGLSSRPKPPSRSDPIPRYLQPQTRAT